MPNELDAGTDARVEAARQAVLAMMPGPGFTVVSTDDLRAVLDWFDPHYLDDDDLVVFDRMRAKVEPE